MRAFYETSPVCFSCTGCGRCCHGHPDEHVIELLPGEAVQIAEFLQLRLASLRQRYLTKESGMDAIRINASGRCMFLDANEQCSIYQARPLQCRSYPFWPEIMGNKKAWLAEAVRCEGINQGPPVAVSAIRKQLQLFEQ